MRFRMLGPLLVAKGTDWKSVSSEKQRIVLALLLASAGMVVSTEHLADVVWDDSRPRNAANTLAAYVMRLRRVVGDDLIATRGRGYELTADPADIDAVLFERKLVAARRAIESGRPEIGATELAEALALWRGSVLADVRPAPAWEARAVGLEQLRLNAVEDHMGVLLDLGRHAEVIVDLHRLVETEPLRERRWALLMTALYRSGRRAEALEVYQRARTMLRTELGLEPGPELCRLQMAILAGETAPTAVVHRSSGTAAPADPHAMVPAQLPADVSNFTGRERQLAHLGAMLPGNDGRAMPIALLTGTAGVGKTALAVRWAHRVAGEFPDGQLFANLRGYAADHRARPIETLARFLRALGVPGDRVPPDSEEAGAMYRSVLSGKRVLVLLDNAWDIGQVRPLLPGSLGCMTVVTSRNRLTGLVSHDGAMPINLCALTDEDAVALLARLLGTGGLDADPEAVAELARLSGNLPLALRIAAANLATHPGDDIADYLTRLESERLDTLEIDGDPDTGVRATLDLSYETLTGSERRMFRRLALAPTTDLTLPTAAALFGTDLSAARRSIDRLAAASLLEEQAAGRYVLHDLVRCHAGERACAEDTEEARQEALNRLYGHYHGHLDVVAEMLYPEILPLPSRWSDRLPARSPGDQRIAFSGKQDAASWIDAELSNLIAITIHTSEHGPREVACRIADGLRGYLSMRKLLTDWQVVADAALTAAESLADPVLQAAGFLGRGLMYSARNRHSEAIGHCSRAVEFARTAGWVAAESAALAGIGGEYLIQGNLRASAGYYSHALELRRQAGWTAGEATAVANLGLVYWGLGQLEQAVEHLGQSSALHRKHGATTSEARVDGALGAAYHSLGHYQEALAVLNSSLARLHEAGDRYYHGYLLGYLADLHCDLGNYRDAIRVAETAKDLADEVGDQIIAGSAWATIGNVHRHLGEHHKAIDDHDRALAIARRTHDEYLETDTLVRLAGAHHSAGHTEVAIGTAEHALVLARQGSYQILEGHALTLLAAANLEHHKPDDALDLALQALRVHARTGCRLGAARTHLVAARARQALGQAPNEHQQTALVLFGELGIDAAPQSAILLGLEGQTP